MKKQIPIKKILFAVFIVLILFLFSLKYIPLNPDSFAGRSKTKLDDLVYPLPLVGGLSKAVKDAYAAAINNVKSNDLEAAESNLKKAVSLKPDFTEAWYNLGATQTLLAIGMAKDEKNNEAVSKFREAVDSKKRSRELMDRNIWYIYKDQEQNNVRHDVKEALEDIEKMLANETGLLFMLKIYRQ
jgi:tetratricopeptide (TPR) repeat protein